MKKELETTYDPGAIEERLYQKWLDNKYFHAEVDETKQPYTIVIPPPNITGKLHMGHALDETLQDILIQNITKGSGDLGKVHMQVESDGVTYQGFSANTDIVAASAEAYIDAINKFVH